jgi:hypothetical protein
MVMGAMDACGDSASQRGPAPFQSVSLSLPPFAAQFNPTSFCGDMKKLSIHLS